MTLASIDDALHEASLAVDNAQEVREYHRKRTARDDKQRNADIRFALERIRAAMKPLRSEIGRFPKQVATASVVARQERIKNASQALQRERRKLWKMMERKL